MKNFLMVVIALTLLAITPASAQESGDIISTAPFSGDMSAIQVAPDTSNMIFASITEDSAATDGLILDTPNAANTNWMSAIPDNRQLNEITIPGTHDSGCSKVWTDNIIGKLGENYAITQSVNIIKQLEAGVRLLDLRWTNCYKDKVDGAKSEDLFLCHGDTILFYCIGDDDKVISFENLMSGIHKFLSDNPTETILLDITKEYDDSASEWRVYPTLTKKLKTYAWIFSEDRVPTLGEVRGKAVLISTHANDLGMGLKISSSNGAGSFTTSDGIHFDYENHYDVDNNDKLKCVDDFYSAHNISPQPKQGLIVYTSSNCASSLGDNPADIAGKVNKSYNSLWENFRKEGRLAGWIYTDFAGDSGSHVNDYDMDCDKIWRVNFVSDDSKYHTLTYKNIGGNVIHSQEVLKGAAITLPEHPVSASVKTAGASGWHHVEGGTVHYGTITPSGDMTLAQHVLSSESGANDTITVINSSSGGCSSGAGMMMYAAVLLIALKMSVKSGR